MIACKSVIVHCRQVLMSTGSYAIVISLQYMFGTPNDHSRCVPNPRTSREKKITDWVSSTSHIHIPHQNQTPRCPQKNHTTTHLNQFPSPSCTPISYPNSTSVPPPSQPRFPALLSINLHIGSTCIAEITPPRWPGTMVKGTVPRCCFCEAERS